MARGSVGCIHVLYTMTLIFTLYSTFAVGSGRGTMCTFNITTSFGSSVMCCASVRMLSDMRLSGGKFLPGHSLCACRLGGCLRCGLGGPSCAYVVCFSRGEGGLRGRTMGMGNGCGGDGGVILRIIGPRTFAFAGPRRWFERCACSRVRALSAVISILLNFASDVQGQKSRAKASHY